MLERELEEHYVEYHRRLTGFLVRRGADLRDVEDLLQSTWLRAWKARASFRGECSVISWLSTIAINELYALHRYRGRHLETPMPENFDVPGPTPEYKIDDAHTRKAVAALECLDPKIREVVRMRVVLDKSIQETCANLGLTVGTVKSRLHRGLKTIRVRLTPTFK